jgi:2-methylcitrate dehydratase PrpD
MSVAGAAATTTVSEQLTAFLREHRGGRVPAAPLHEAKRLLLNQLKASVGAGDHPAIRILHDWVKPPSGDESAHVLWFGTETSPEQAAVVNGALFEVLDFHDTYIPCFMHAVSGVLPAALAVAEAEGASGARLLEGLTLGVEAELAVAEILMPTGYYRGFVPAGLVGGVGAAAACSVIADLDDVRTRNALGLAMLTAGGTYESVGSMALSYITGVTARGGLTAYELAARGLDAPVTAFEGEKGMLASYSDEPAEKIPGVLRTLGEEWRIHGQSYKTMLTETITHGPVECVLRLLDVAGERELDHMRFGVEPIVVNIADERRDRFGDPSSELEARFDLRHCVAAAWERRRFTREEMREPAYTDPRILAHRAQVILVPDEARETFDGCWLEMTFTDGSTESITIDAFTGSAANPLSDPQLTDLFITTATEFLGETRAREVATRVLALERVEDTRALMEALRW